MSHKIIILESAEQDLKELKQYLVKNFSHHTWRESYDKIKQSIRSLKNFPETGSIPEEFKQLNFTQYRQVISGMNRIIYEVRQNTVYIHVIADARQDLKLLLIRRLLRL